ncbi:hypothetical protein niasHT_008243 [Heterodera trifolii]|uniref:Uncharacterized protein n=1 Tax=Heterodera trifolii TaxID=157864 RepID=A0ABD2LUH1_9BILA
MITRSLRRNENQRRVVGENAEQRRNKNNLENDANAFVFPEQNGRNNQQNNGNNHHSEPMMEDDEIRRALLDVNGQQKEQNQQLDAEEEQRLLDQII